MPRGTTATPSSPGPLKGLTGNTDRVYFGFRPASAGRGRRRGRRYAIARITRGRARRRASHQSPHTARRVAERARVCAGFNFHGGITDFLITARRRLHSKITRSCGSIRPYQRTLAGPASRRRRPKAASAAAHCAVGCGARPPRHHTSRRRHPPPVVCDRIQS